MSDKIEEAIDPEDPPIKIGTSEEQEEEWQEHKKEFIEAFKDYPLNGINDVLQAHPDNVIEATEWTEAGHAFTWSGCPLKMTASYHANNKMGIQSLPVYGINELKALLDAKEATS